MPEDLDFRLLRMFTLLARTGSFTRTAASLGLTQSAVSHGMRRLEEQLGCSLLYKSGKTTHLTSEGQIFLTHAQRILEAGERATEAVTGRFSESRGTLHVIFSTSVAGLMLAPVLREFRESYPNVSVVIRLEDTPGALRELEAGRCDLAILVEERLPRSLKAHSLFRDEIQLVYSPLHRWAELRRISAREMSREHFLLYQRRSITFLRIEQFFLHQGVQLSSYVEIPSFEIMKQLARLGLGVALMAPWVARTELEEGSLLARSLPRKPIRRHWIVARQANRSIRQPEQTFIGLCQLASRDLGTPPTPAGSAPSVAVPRTMN